MRKEIYRGGDAEGRALFERADAVTLALVSETGAPILRVVNAVVVDGSIAFHGAPAGEKMDGLGRRAVASAHETIASIPSWFLDRERACPATTYYVSAQAHGTLALVTDPSRKARVLAALMAKYQPEGGHVPITADDPLYAKAIRGLLVAEIAIETLDCKAKLGQNRTPKERLAVLEGLWRRGDPGDVRAIATILARFPELPRPSFLPPHEGTTLECHLEGDALDEAADLLDGAYWLTSQSRKTIAGALRRSTAIVGARDASGRLVAFARAVSDGKLAWIYDVIVDPRVQRRGVGGAVMRVLLDHPAVRGARLVRLTTRDAMDFYRRLGFDDVARAHVRPWKTVDMIKIRTTS
jgi:ribosomal protein S18 acetylase RimI-like enzyme/nitroimidazol reductase NimA-like FMN-containing flavoprotein (pyridoxamine 5'-phosphate oxidase superfamily)